MEMPLRMPVFYKVPITNDGVQISSAQSKFGGTSFYFNGASKLTFPQTTHQFGSGDFTIEWWEYSTASSNGSRFCSEFTGSTYGGILLGYLGHQVYISSVIQLTWDIVSGVSILNVTANQWVHWAVVRSGNTLKSYRNGVLYATTSMNGTGNVVYNTQYPMAIGDYRTGDHSYFTGYIDEFRIVDYAVYTSNFTPPTEPYSSSIGTVDVGNKKKNTERLC